jgi:hypothetical protein
MTELLVGHTGFVGSNLAAQHRFDVLCNSKNVAESFGSSPDLCVYAGVRAEKFLAVQDPAADLELVQTAIRNITQINPKRLLLISTIDVYPHPLGVDENSPITPDTANPYGAHRLLLEDWVRENIQDHLVMRLPALFGLNIKKNFIHDMLNPVPSMLKTEKFNQFAAQEPLLNRHYTLQPNGFYKRSDDVNRQTELREAFDRLGFSALNFTDSRSSYQYYNLACLWGHLQIALDHHLPLLNLAVEPVSVSELYQSVRGADYSNEVGTRIDRYDFRTIHAGLFGGSDGYIFRKERVMADIREFIRQEDLRRA